MVLRDLGRAGHPSLMEGTRFEFVCADCLSTRGLLDADRLPDVCPDCGARDPWVGPFVKMSRFDAGNAEQVLYTSPFYLSGAVPSSDY